MNTAELLADGFGRVREEVHAAVRGLSGEQLALRLDGRANSIGWLVWHLTRVQDDHVADVAGAEQAWTAGGWYERFGLALPAASTGYGHTSAEVDQVRVDSPELLTGYYDAVHEHTMRFVSAVRDADLDRIVDERWNPPVTLGVRLVSVLSDDFEHVGQAAFVRGLVA
ncbi:mycothiol transferase [Pseudonocardia acaciae]|uniref:mycothiol transferase n=1 Tax=Pseudonocardia acaciae TaxID=551276 RepID=UPI00048CB140|nr:DinB family protein [Pseudonocardia acaciae]